MNSPEYAELIARVLDGESTSQERALLDELRAENASVRVLYEDLAATNDMLRRLALRQPPPDLKSRIMAALPADRYAPAARARLLPRLEQIRDALLGTVRARPAFALAYSLALGAAVGIGTVATLGDGPSQPPASDVYATMAGPELVSQLQTTAEREISAGGAAGVARLMSGEGQVFVELELSSPADAQLSVGFDPVELDWGGLARLGGRAPGVVAAGDGHLDISFSGAVHLLLSFDRTAGASQLTLAVSGGDAGPIRVTLSGDGR